MTTITRIRKRTPVLTIALISFAFAGCADNAAEGPVVKGTLVLPDGIVLSPQASVTLSFVPEDPTNPRGFGSVSLDDKSFTVRGTAGKGIRPGKYLIFLQIAFSGGYSNETVEAVNKRFNNLPAVLSYEVTAEPDQIILIDAVKGTVTPK